MSSGPSSPPLEQHGRKGRLLQLVLRNACELITQMHRPAYQPGRGGGGACSGHKSHAIVLQLQLHRPTYTTAYGIQQWRHTRHSIAATPSWEPIPPMEECKAGLKSICYSITELSICGTANAKACVLADDSSVHWWAHCWKLSKACQP